jgi:hypothetical protein
MLRFIIKNSFKLTCGHQGVSFYTIDDDINELERCLKKGGHGEDMYDIHEVIGTEIIETN